MTKQIIDNLQKALSCSEKCDCCNRIQQQNNALKNKTDNLEKLYFNLNKEVSNLKKKLVRRESSNEINALKRQVAAIERYLNNLDNIGKQVISVFNKFIGLFTF